METKVVEVSRSHSFGIWSIESSIWVYRLTRILCQLPTYTPLSSPPTIRKTGTEQGFGGGWGRELHPIYLLISTWNTLITNYLLALVLHWLHPAFRYVLSASVLCPEIFGIHCWKAKKRRNTCLVQGMTNTLFWVQNRRINFWTHDRRSIGTETRLLPAGVAAVDVFLWVLNQSTRYKTRNTRRFGCIFARRRTVSIMAFIAMFRLRG